MKLDSHSIAVVGIAVRVPGARTVEALWDNLLSGVESVGVGLEDVALFDAEFFGFSAREARVTDPQHRVFLQTAWEALEDAGITPGPWPRIGVFASTTASSYLFANIQRNKEFRVDGLDYPTLIGNDKDFLACRVAFKLGLTGPAVTVASACSSSLVAIHQAARSLRAHDSDVALAGGVSIVLSPRPAGDDAAGIFSADGRCRPFDRDAAGTARGDGCGVVVLKRLDDALDDGDHVYAVLAGSAVNNDGSEKISFTAPGLAGQSAVIAAAIADSHVPASDIGYVETHGTGTALGDPIEFRALSRAHENAGGPAADCELGSIKANLGHLDAAAGVLGFIKTVLVLHHRTIPPQINFTAPNPHVPLDRSPYRISTEALARPLRAAAVSSFGLGGTNAHCVLTEPPGGRADSARPPRPRHSFTLAEYWIAPDDGPAVAAPVVVTSDGDPAPDLAAFVLDTVRDLLGAPALTADADFFAAGGESMTLFRLLAAVRRQYDVTLRIPDLQGLRTIGDIADRLRTTVAAPSGTAPILLPIAEGTGRTLYLVPPAGGTNFCYQLLAAHLPGYGPIAAFTAADAADDLTMRELAARNVAELLRHDPGGPYRLGGYSFGGNVAFEMALQLEHAGHTVGEVVLFDSNPPEAYVGGRIDDAEFLTALVQMVETAFPELELDPADRPTSLDDLPGLLRSHPEVSAFTEDDAIRFAELWRQNHNSIKRYYPDRAYGGLLTILRAAGPHPTDEQTLRIRPVDKQQWGTHSTGEVRIHDVPGNHYTMFTDAALLPQVAAALTGASAR